MATKRTGTLGTYYGSTEGTSEPLTQEEMQVNAKYIYRYLLDKGWSIHAIAGMLGNMQAESSINPGRWQSDDVGNYSGGYGLVQWTPSTKYTSWVSTKYGLSADPSEMDKNLARILYEVEQDSQWIATDTYDFTFEEFTHSNESVEYLASAFLKNYERAGVEVEETRRTNARYWYDYLLENGGGGITPGTSNYTKRKTGFKFYLYRKVYQ